MSEASSAIVTAREGWGENKSAVAATTSTGNYSRHLKGIPAPNMDSMSFPPRPDLPITATAATLTTSTTTVTTAKNSSQRPNIVDDGVTIRERMEKKRRNKRRTKSKNDASQSASTATKGGGKRTRARVALPGSSSVGRLSAAESAAEDDVGLLRPRSRERPVPQQQQQPIGEQDEQENEDPRSERRTARRGRSKRGGLGGDRDSRRTRRRKKKAAKDAAVSNAVRDAVADAEVVEAIEESTTNGGGGHNNANNAQVVAVTVHKADALGLKLGLLRPYIRVSLVNRATGSLIRRGTATTATNTSGTSRGQRTDQHTRPYDLRAHRTMAPVWNETVVCDIDFADIVDPANEAVVLLELLDASLDNTITPRTKRVATTTSDGGDGGGRSGWWADDGIISSRGEQIPTAWAFLSCTGPKGQSNAGVRARLQLYLPPGVNASRGLGDRRRRSRRQLSRRSLTRLNGFGSNGPGGKGSNNHAAVIDNDLLETAPPASLWLAQAAVKGRNPIRGSIYVSIKPTDPQLSVRRRGGLAAKEDAAAAGVGAAKGRSTGNGALLGEPLSLQAAREMRKIRQANPGWQRLEGQLCKLPNRPRYRVVAGTRGCFTLAFSRDGTRLAAACCDEGVFPIRLLSVAAVGDKVPECATEGILLGHHNLVYDLSWSTDDKLLLSASSDGTVCVWDAEDCAPTALHTLPHPCYVYTANFRVTGDPLAPKQVVTGGYDGVIRIWELSGGSTGRLLHEVQAHAAPINSLVIDSGGIKLFTADGTGVIKVWAPSNTKHGAYELFKVIKDPEIAGDAISHIELHPHGRRLLVHARDNMVRVLDLRTFAFMQHMSGATNAGTRVCSAFSPCGSFVLAGSEDGAAYAWNTDTGKTLCVYGGLGFTDPVCSVAFHPRDNMAAFCAFGTNQPILIYEYDAAAALHAAQTEAAEVHSEAARTAAAVAASASATAASAAMSGGGAGVNVNKDPLQDLMDLQKMKEERVTALLDSAVADIDMRTTILRETGAPIPLSPTRRVGVERPDSTDLDDSRRGLTTEMRRYFGERGMDIDTSALSLVQGEHLDGDRAMGSALAQAMREGIETGAAAAASAAASSTFVSSWTTSTFRPDVSAVAAADLEAISRPPVWVKAIYSYQGRRKDELSFSIGDPIQVVQKSERNWWRGRLTTGQEGLFPITYVKDIDLDGRTLGMTGAPLGLGISTAVQPFSGLTDVYSSGAGGNILSATSASAGADSTSAVAAAVTAADTFAIPPAGAIDNFATSAVVPESTSAADAAATAAAARDNMAMTTTATAHGAMGTSAADILSRALIDFTVPQILVDTAQPSAPSSAVSSIAAGTLLEKEEQEEEASGTSFLPDKTVFEEPMAASILDTTTTMSSIPLQLSAEAKAMAAAAAAARSGLDRVEQTQQQQQQQQLNLTERLRVRRNSLARARIETPHLLPARKEAKRQPDPVSEEPAERRVLGGRGARFGGGEDLELLDI